MKYTTCVSVAARTPRAMASRASRALESSQYAELRLDFLRPASIPGALDMVGRRLSRCVCTLRPASEGGMFSGGEKERASILKLASEYGPHMVDIEASALARNRDLAAYVRGTGTPILASWHDFSGTPGPAALSRRLASMQRLSPHVKMVTTARGPGDAARVLALYGGFSGGSLVAFAMGEHGRLSRILCLYMGSPWTYVSMGRPVAPGQYSLAQVRRMA